MADSIVQIWLPKIKMPEGGVPKSQDQAVTKVLSTIENVGHAALALSDGTYISWWPDQSVSPDSGFQSPSFLVHTFDDDCKAEGSLPDVSANVRDLEEGSIRSWWVRIAETGFAIPYTFENNPKTNRFDLWQTNCSNIVAIALRLGGCDKILPLPRFDIQTPIHIAAWAKAAQVIQALRGR
jgi:hypothetical protein